jgi:hypothetical protein
MSYFYAKKRKSVLQNHNKIVLQHAFDIPELRIAPL